MSTRSSAGITTTRSAPTRPAGPPRPLLP
jgi:hypothetical protein